MMKTKIGLLIDLNSFPHFQQQEYLVNDENYPMEDGFSTTSGSCTELLQIDPRLESTLKQLQEFILEQLTKEGTVRGNFDPADLQFTFRYFNSSNYVHPIKEQRTFLPFNLNAFESFERSLETEVRNIFTSEKDLCPSINKMNLMSFAFKGMISDFDWAKRSDEKESLGVTHFPRSVSSSSVKSSGSSDSISPLNYSRDDSFRNIIYIFFRVPRDEDDMQSFVDDVPDKLDIATSSKKFLNAFIPKAFLEMITHTYQMRVNFIDMGTLDSSSTETLGAVGYPNSIVKVLRHLHSGQILQAVTRTRIDTGLPSWRTFLKNNIKAHVNQCFAGSDSDTASHISDSSRCSTPVHNFSSKLQAIMRLAPMPSSAAKSESDKRGEFRSSSTERSRLRRDAVLNSQSNSLSFSQPSTRTNNRIHQRFSSKSSHTILLPKATKSVIPFAQDNLDFLKLSSSGRRVEVTSSASCPNSKKVRRNLFSVNSQEPSEEIQRLLSSSARFNFHRSPPSARGEHLARNLFRSPKTTTCLSQVSSKFKSPESSTVLKSRAQLDMDAIGRGASASRSPPYVSSPPGRIPGVICPESPSTPPAKRAKLCGISSCEKRDVVTESPESANSKNVFKKSHFTRHDSFTFYSSSSSESLPAKSRLWEESGKKLQAARIKDSVDLSRIATESLTLDDLELINPMDSPLSKDRYTATDTTDGTWC